MIASWAWSTTITASPTSRLGTAFLNELEEFFVNCRALTGDQYRILGAEGPNRARKISEQGMKRYALPCTRQLFLSSWTLVHRS